MSSLFEVEGVKLIGGVIKVKEARLIGLLGVLGMDPRFGGGEVKLRHQN